MSIIHEALKKASRKREGLFHLIEYEPFYERIHIEKSDKVKRHAVIIIICLVALNASIFIWNFSLKSEMRRLALSALPQRVPGEQAEVKEAPPAALLSAETRPKPQALSGRPAARPEATPGHEEEAVLVAAPAEEEPRPEKEKDLPELILKGTVISQTRSRAFINNSMVKEGDTIEGAEIMSIQENVVLLRKGDREFELKK